MMDGPDRWRTPVSGAVLSRAVNGGAAAIVAANNKASMGFSLNALLEDQIGEGIAGGGGEQMRQARRNHQPVAGMQDLGLAAHQLAAAHFQLAGIGGAVLGATIGDGPLARQLMDIVVPVA